MDINNELQQINTFVKGMNTDVSDALIDSSQYRYAENIRLTTDKEENTGELRLIEGTSIHTDLSNFGKVIAMTSIRDILIVITKLSCNYIVVKDLSETPRWEGWRTCFQTKSGEYLGDHISLVTRWESDNNVKLYIADGVHPLMYVNIMANNEDQYVTNQGIESISGVKSVFLNQPDAQISGNGGHLNAPKLQYAYRLYKIGGATTTLSPTSKLVVLYKSGTQGYETPDENGNYNISKTITVTIPENTTDCEYLQIFRIQYASSGNPTVALIYDDLYTQSYTDSGYDIQSIDYSEFLSYIKFNTVPQIIESKNDYLFSANINDVQSQMDDKYKNIDLSCITLTLDFSREVRINNKNQRWFSGDSGDEKEQIRSLKPGEVYRYGVILYDSRGNHTSAKFLKDITVTVPSGEELIRKPADKDYYIFKQIGVKPVVDWSALIHQCADCQAIEIVRCKRTIDDMYTITQGIAGYPLMIYDGPNHEKTNVLCSPGILSTSRFAVTGHMKFENTGDPTTPEMRAPWIQPDTFAISDDYFLLFASPEYVYQKDDIKNVIETSSIKITHDAIARSPITNRGYDQADKDDINTYRISSVYDRYDHGVPYCLYRIPETSGETGTEQCYQFLYNNYIRYLSNNEAPTYRDNQNMSDDYYAFIYSAWIAGHFAYKSWEKNDNTNYPGYINPRALHMPKVHTSVSEYTIYPLSQPNEKVIDGNIGYAKVPEYDKLFGGSDGKLIVGKDDRSIGPQSTYMNWILPISYNTDKNSDGIFGSDHGYIRVPEEDDLDNDDDEIWDYYSAFQAHGGQYTYPIGSTGECMIIKQTFPNGFRTLNPTIGIAADILSIKRTDVIPYGGAQTTDLSTYTSYGNVILKNDISQNVIYDGDCFPGMFVYNASHAWYAPLGGGVAQMNVQIVPLYSYVDLAGTFGDLFPNMTQENRQWIQDVPCTINNYVQEKQAYKYNTMYNLDPTAMSYMSIKYTAIDSALFDTRVYHSAVKNNNEYIDSWLQFSPNDYIDVDTRFGQITNMRLFKDKLLFWQEHAVGILSVNERTVLNDVNSNDIVVGTGGTLQRYDYISTVYGMKFQQYDAEVQSNTTQYWWDGYHKEILAYGGGMELVPMTKIKGVTNYINQRNEVTHPSLAYDIKYDEVLAHVVEDDTLVYNEQIQAFSSIYTFNPVYKAIVNNKLYLVPDKSSEIYTYNTPQIEGYSLLFNNPIYPKVRTVVNKNSIYTKTFDNFTFGGRIYKGSLQTMVNWPMQRTDGEYVTGEHLNSPMHHLIFTFETPLKQKSAVRGDKAVSVDEYDYRLAIPRNGSQDAEIEYGNRMRGKTMQCEIASDYNSTDFSLQYITTKFRMSWS